MKRVMILIVALALVSSTVALVCADTINVGGMARASSPINVGGMVLTSSPINVGGMALTCSPINVGGS